MASPTRAYIFGVDTHIPPRGQREVVALDGKLIRPRSYPTSFVVSYDGSAWTRRYAELGLSVTRPVAEDDIALAFAYLPIWIADPAHYSTVVHAAFGQRRKTLRNALRASWDDAAVDAALGASGIDGGRRGETLDIADFGRLAAALPVRSASAQQ